MKKTILYLLVAMFALGAYSQNSPMAFSEVVTEEKAEKKALVARAKSFFESKKYEVKSDAESVSGVGKFTLDYPSVVKGKMEKGEVHFNFTVTCKEGRYKYDFTNFRHVGINGKANGGPLELVDAECGRAQIAAASWAKIKTDTQEEVKKLVQSLKNNMSEITKAADKDNW